MTKQIQLKQQQQKTGELKYQRTWHRETNHEEEKNQNGKFIHPGN